MKRNNEENIHEKSHVPHSILDHLLDFKGGVGYTLYLWTFMTY